MLKKTSNPNDVYVGGRVRRRRMLLGMSQERLGELLHLTFQQVQKYEKGVNRIGAGRLFDIAGILSAPIDYFFDGLTAREQGTVGTAMPADEVMKLAIRLDKLDPPYKRKQCVAVVDACILSFEKLAATEPA